MRNEWTKYLLLWLLITCSVSAQAQEPKMSWLDNGQIRLGVDLSIGGAVTHLSEGEDGPNLINSFDWGRQVQMSFYSGPVPYLPDGATVHDSWKQLGWNPIQSGDVYENRSEVTAHRNDGKELYVRCTPMHWPLKGVPGECAFECWFTLEGNTVKARARLTNRRPDKTQYPARAQELPAVYSNGPWYKLVTYIGDKPFTNAKPTVVVDRDDGKGWPWRNYQSTERWSALLDKDDRGLGVYMPDALEFVGGFAGQKGSGGSKDSPTGYMSPLIRETLDHNIVFDYDYTLIVGSLKEIRDYVYEQEKDRGLPSWSYAKDRQHWVCDGAIDEGWPVREGLRADLGQAKQVVLSSPKTFWRSEDAPVLTIRASFKTKATTATLLLQPYDELAAGDWAQWGPERAKRPKPAEPLRIPFKINGDSRIHTIKIDLSAHTQYRGGMTQIKLVLPKVEGHVHLEAVTLHAPPDGSKLADLVTPVMTDDEPAAGKRVRQVTAEYEGTDVYHALYLPTDWEKGKTYPVIVEYTGNKFPPGKGSGEVKDANLGYGLTGGKGYIWITMPYVQKGGKENAVTWWGDRQATIDYCKTNLPRICEAFGGDLDNVILCGFSRGAIACGYIGLADDEIAKLWKGMVAHDHFDGQRQWGYPESDREAALNRLARLKGRPVLVSGTGNGYLKEHLDLAEFAFLPVPVAEIFDIPEGPVMHPHTDAWMHRESEYRRQARDWLGNQVSADREP